MITSWLHHDYVMITSWLRYDSLLQDTATGHMHQCWYDNPQSLTIKYNYAITSWLRHDNVMITLWLRHDYVMILPCRTLLQDICISVGTTTPRVCLSSITTPCRTRCEASECGRRTTLITATLNRGPRWDRKCGGQCLNTRGVLLLWRGGEGVMLHYAAGGPRSQELLKCWESSGILEQYSPCGGARGRGVCCTNQQGAKVTGSQCEILESYSCQPVGISLLH